jgi:hypothetical protein
MTVADGARSVVAMRTTHTISGVYLCQVDADLLVGVVEPVLFPLVVWFSKRLFSWTSEKKGAK